MFALEYISYLLTKRRQSLCYEQEKKRFYMQVIGCSLDKRRQSLDYEQQKKKFRGYNSLGQLLLTFCLHY
jgi:DNA-dependent RNA polymerase auxiliary subunit epsilon